MSSEKEKYLKAYSKLSWMILHHKFRYYEGAKYNIKPVPDNEYDTLENMYKKIAKKLNEKTTASDMVGFNNEKASCRMIANNLISTHGKPLFKIKIKGKVYYA